MWGVNYILFNGDVVHSNCPVQNENEKNRKTSHVEHHCGKLSCNTPR